MPRHAIETKWVFLVLLSWFAMAGALVWTSTRLALTHEAAQIGKSVDCPTRPHWEALLRCDTRTDGPACVYETQTSLMEWVGPIDYACAQFEPERQFRFPVHKAPESLEVAEAQQP